MLLFSKDSLKTVANKRKLFGNIKLSVLFLSLVKIPQIKKYGYIAYCTGKYLYAGRPGRCRFARTSGIAAELFGNYIVTPHHPGAIQWKTTFFLGSPGRFGTGIRLFNPHSGSQTFWRQ
jgi:hypothetical protein